MNIIINLLDLVRQFFLGLLGAGIRKIELWFLFFITNKAFKSMYFEDL